MKIFLINPCCAIEESRDLYTNDVASALVTMQPFNKVALGIPLALPTLAAHTPPQHEVKIIDEEIEPIDFDASVDLVGITAMSFKAKRAYEISAEFKKRGIAVVLGGIHASMCPDEALQYVDSVVIGEAEDIWGTVIADAQAGRLKPLYKADEFPDLEKSNIPRYDLIKNKRYAYTYLQTSRGCPHDCKFCTVTKQNGRKVRKKTPQQVVAELDALLKLKPKKEFVFRDSRDGGYKKFAGSIAFIDDNFAIDRDHAIAVCKALQQYQEDHHCIIGWYTQVNINIGFDEELLNAMTESNCFHVFIGIESIDPNILKKMNKKMNSPKRYAEAIGNIHRHGIRIIASTIIGEDGTSWESVASLKSFLEENSLLHVLVNILTPYPGTEIREEFIREGRLLTRNPQKYNIRNVVFKPQDIPKGQLEEMYVWLCRSIFDYRASYRRGIPLLKTARRYSLPVFLRLPTLAGFLFSLFILILRGKIRAKAAVWALYKLPYLILFTGSFSAVELLPVCLDYDDFAYREEKRFMTGSITLGNENNLLSLPHQIEAKKSRSNKRYGTFYVSGDDLCKYGFTVSPENLHNPALLLGGTSIRVSDRRRLIKSFLEAGYEVASIENPLGNAFSFRINPVKERPEALKEFIAYLQCSHDVESITLVTQSYSAFEAVRVLLEDPIRYKDLVKCIVLVNPPGFDESLSMPKHIFRFLWKHVIQGYLHPKTSHPDQIGFRKKERTGIFTWTLNSMTNTVRGLREVHDIVHYRLKAPLKELIDHGYKVCFFLQSNDQVVPAHITMKCAMKLVPQEQIKCVPGGHNDLFFQEWQRQSFIDFYQQMTDAESKSRF
jgi:radical SAM superfamily enzyme YgiQ (UPF0313 family)/pimeloyl-ACP methyl ester carboxylesterase